MAKLLVVIPCRNEANSIQSVIERIPRQMASLNSVDVVVIDDGSVDGTGSIAREAGARVIKLFPNQGLGVAFQTGLSAALEGGYDLMVTVDGDGQFSPEQMPRLLEPVLAGESDMTTGSRFLPESVRDGMPVVKRLGNAVMSILVSRLTRKKFWDVSCGFRCYGTESLVRMNLFGKFTYTQETFLNLAMNGLRIKEVPISVVYFPERKSRVAGSLTRYAGKACAILFRGYRDYFPLRFFWGIAALPLAVGLGFGIGFLANFLRTGRFAGFLFAGFTAAMLLMIGIALVLFGVLADMLGRNRRNDERILELLKRHRHEAARQRTTDAQTPPNAAQPRVP